MIFEEETEKKSEKTEENTSPVFTINVTNTFTKLHKVAKQAANEKNSSISLEDTGFDENGNFIGGTTGDESLPENGVMVLMKSTTEEVPEKAQFLDVIKEYITYLFGESFGNKIKEDDLNELKSGENEETPENNETSDNSEQNTGGNTENQPVHESKMWKKPILATIFEATDQNQPQTQDNGNQTTDGGTSQTDNPTENDGGENAGGKIVGYSFVYAVQIAGRKPKKSDSVKAKVKGLFGDLLDNLQSLKITSKRFGDINVGKMFDPDEWKNNAFKKPDIDANTIPSDIKDVFNRDYPENATQVKVYRGEAIEKFLNDQKDNLSQEDQKNLQENISKIKKANLSIVMRVQHNDPNYDSYNVDTIAEICNKSFGRYDKLIDRNKLKGKDVIFVKNATDAYEYKDEYKKDKKDEKSKTTKNLKVTESKEFIVPVRICEAEENTETESTGNGVVKSGEYLEFMRKQLEDQIEREMKGNKVTGSGVVPSEEYVQSDSFKKLNDSSIAKILKDESPNVAYIEFESSASKEVARESLDNKDKLRLIDALFEDMNSRYPIRESDEGEDLTEFMGQIDYQNITDDQKFNQQTKDKLKNGARIQAKIEKAQMNAITHASKALKNAVLNTIDEYKLDIKNPELNAITSSRELENVNESVITGDDLIHLIFEDTDLKQHESWGEAISEEFLRVDFAFNQALMRQKPKGEHLHHSSWGAVSTKERVIGYLKEHGIAESGVGELEKLDKPFAAVVVAKRDPDFRTRETTVKEAEEKDEFKGSTANEFYTDESIGGVFKFAFKNCKPEILNGGKAIQSDNAIKEKLGRIRGDLIEIALGYSKDSKKDSKTMKDQATQPILDVWICAFDDPAKVEDKKPGEGGGNGDVNVNVNVNVDNSVTVNQLMQMNQQINILQNFMITMIAGGGDGKPKPLPSSVNVSLLIYVMLPDPIPKPPKGKEEDEREPGDKDGPTDLYIVPKDNLKYKNEEKNRPQNDLKNGNYQKIKSASRYSS